ncbi:MAG: MlaD family protein [Candidatus Omnitrophota bacterium]|jgi:phospholipid/cholesterol/gamma-HCH transport system substrate-binding protein
MANNFTNIKKYFAEVKVGAFFVGAILILLLTLISMRSFNFLKQKNEYKVKFNFSEGLRSSSPVRFCGVDVGEVKDVEVKQEADLQPFVYVNIKVDSNVNIPKNSYFFINSLSLFGEKYLEIVPPAKPQGYLVTGEMVEGISPTPLFNVLTNFNKTMEEVNEFVKNGKIRDSLQNTITNIEKISSDVRCLMEDVKNKKGTLGRLFYDDSLYTKTEELIDEIKQNPWKLLHKTKDSK